MKHGFGLNKILGTIHIYPTLAETNKYVAGNWKKNHAPQKVLDFLKKFHGWRRGEKKLASLLVGIITIGLFMAPNLKADDSIWQNYQQILTKVVTPVEYTGQDGSYTHSSVDYQKLYKNTSLKKLISEQSKKLNTTLPPKERSKKLAFWINAYNFFTLVEVVDHMPDIASLKDIGWKNKKFKVNKTPYSLDHIEHKILRPLAEARIHFVINCASVSCPSLSDKIYVAEKLESQLTEAVQNAFRNPMHIKIGAGYFGFGGDLIKVTKLLSWFGEDFEQQNGNGPLTFIHKYAPARFQSYQDYSASLHYNWQLNTKENITSYLKELK